MKINTNLENNFLVYFSEARGMALHKEGIVKSKNSDCFTYFQEKLIIFTILFIINCLISFYSTFNYSLFIFSAIVLCLSLLYFLFLVMNVVKIYCFRKKQNFSNTILIDRNGITDESYYGIKMTFNWDKIKGVVIGKNTVTILTDTPIYFYFNISEKDKVIKAIKKYGDKEKIIY